MGGWGSSEPVESQRPEQNAAAPTAGQLRKIGERIEGWQVLIAAALERVPLDENFTEAERQKALDDLMAFDAADELFAWAEQLDAGVFRWSEPSSPTP